MLKLKQITRKMPVCNERPRCPTPYFKLFFYFFSPRFQSNIIESIIFLSLQASCATGTGGLA